MLTLQEFIDTGYEVANLAMYTGEESDEGIGRIYAFAEYYIGRDDQNNWYVYVEGSFISTPNLYEAEEFLYTNLYVPENAE